MIVRCPECKREYNLELNDAVVELNFTCPNCGLEFKVRNHNDSYECYKCNSRAKHAG